jgi:hypothetical protein
MREPLAGFRQGEAGGAQADEVGVGVQARHPRIIARIALAANCPAFAARTRDIAPGRGGERMSIADWCILGLC